MSPHTHAMARAHAQVPDTQANPQLPYLPAEMRVKIWRAALSYGIHYVNLTSKNCPVAWRAAVIKLIELGPDYEPRRFGDPVVESLLNPVVGVSLSPPALEHMPSAFKDRIRVMQTLLKTCRETRHEVLDFYPHSVSTPTGVLRFHGGRDVISILDKTVLRRSETSVRPGERSARWHVTGNWPIEIRRLALGLRSDTGVADAELAFNEFVDLLSEFPNVEQCFLRTTHAISLPDLEKAGWESDGYPLYLKQVFPSGLCYQSVVKLGLGEAQGSLERWDPKELDSHYERDFKTFYKIVNLCAKRKRGSPVRDRIASRHLQILRMCDVDSELEGFCQQLDFQCNFYSELEEFFQQSVGWLGMLIGSLV